MTKFNKPEMTFNIFTENLNEKHEELRDKLMQYNAGKIGSYEKKEVLFSYCDKARQMIAGLYAYQKLGMFFIDLLWVDEAYRRQKLGIQLLKKAEDYARKHQALYIRVNTGSFQAPEFYKKNGFELFAKFPLKTEGLKDQYDYYFIKWLDKSLILMDSGSSSESDPDLIQG